MVRHQIELLAGHVKRRVVVNVHAASVARDYEAGNNSFKGHRIAMSAFSPLTRLTNDE